MKKIFSIWRENISNLRNLVMHAPSGLGEEINLMMTFFCQFQSFICYIDLPLLPQMFQRHFNYTKSVSLLQETHLC